MVLATTIEESRNLVRSRYWPRRSAVARALRLGSAIAKGYRSRSAAHRRRSGEGSATGCATSGVEGFARPSSSAITALAWCGSCRSPVCFPEVSQFRSILRRGEGVPTRDYLCLPKGRAIEFVHRSKHVMHSTDTPYYPSILQFQIALRRGKAPHGLTSRCGCA